jgi:chromosome segregation ATPase
MVALAVSIALLPAAGALAVLSRPERAARFLQNEGQRLESEELLQLGSQVNLPGDLDKVKQMIGNMIARHQTAQAEDTDHKSFCDKEMVASQAKLGKLKMDIQKRTADQDLHSAQLAELKDSISDLHTEIANAHKDKKKAADLREKEADEYKQNKAQSDQTLLESKRALRSDIPSQREAAQKTEEEVTLKQVRAENKDEDAQSNFKKLDGELAVAIAKKTKQVEQKEHKVVSMTHELSLGDGDYKMAQEEMAAAKDYAEKIKTSCTVRQDPVKERKRSREQQITSLKEAYGILTGDDVPVMS